MQVANTLAPEVALIMGHEVTEIGISVTAEPIPGFRAAATALPARNLVIVGRELAECDDADLRALLAHELTHVYARGYWETLPDWAEEGLAEWVAVQVTGSEEKVAYRGRFRRVSEIGFEKLQTLAQRAYSENLSEIPAEWLHSN